MSDVDTRQIAAALRDARLTPTRAALLLAAMVRHDVLHYRAARQVLIDYKDALDIEDAASGLEFVDAHDAFAALVEEVER